MSNFSQSMSSKLRSLNASDARRFGTCVAGGLTLALMTGPSGSNATPMAGIKGSLLTGHVWANLAIGLVVFVASTYRAKTRAGEWGSTTSHRAPLRSRFGELVRDARWFVRLLVFLAVLVGALTVATFSGPPAINKFSAPVYLHQFRYTRTYAYLLVAILFWTAWALPAEGAFKSVIRRLFSRSWLVLLTGAASGLAFAWAADPFLAPTLSWSALSFSTSVSTSLFSHWPTYAWTLGGLGLGFAILIRRRRPGLNVGRLAGKSATSQTILYAFALFVAIDAPKFVAPYWQVTLYQQIGVFCLLAIGLNVVVGFAGLLDLGYVAFFALGAYVAAYFTGALPMQPPFVLNPFLVIPLAIIAAMLSGVLLGLPTLRLKGDYLAIVTLGFGEVIVVLANNVSRFTGGSQGTHVIPTFTFQLFGIHYTWQQSQPLPYYYMMLAVLIVTAILFNALNHSRVGRSWAAIREDEVAAESLGISTLKYKVMAFAIGASTAGVAGVFTASKVGVLFPQTFVLQLSITVLVLVLFGGMGSLSGVMLGAAFLQWLPIYLTFHSYFGYQQQDLFLYLGALLVIMMIFRPQGLVSAQRKIHTVDENEGQAVGS